MNEARAFTVAAGHKEFRPEPQMFVSEWTDQFRRLNGEEITYRTDAKLAPAVGGQECRPRLENSAGPFSHLKRILM